MTRSSVLLFLIVTAAGAAPRTVTLSGWFSDQGCASGRANSGTYTATNPECARKCIENGSPVVFISEQEKALYLVKDYAGVKDDLGYKLEVTSAVDDTAKTISVQSVKHLQIESASCARPRAKK